MKESSVKTLNSENKYTRENSFKGWIITTVRNLFINHYSKVMNELIYIERSENSDYLHLPQHSDFESAQGACDLKEMSHIMNELSKDYKIPFSMHISGFKYQEIADKLGLSVDAVKSRISYAFGKLQMGYDVSDN